MRQPTETIKNIEIETDLARIKELSGKREKENWAFRAFLKGECSSRKLDSLVHELYGNVKAMIDCTTCANCCLEMTPLLDKGDIRRLAKGLEITPKELTDQYLKKYEEDFTFIQMPCPFLHDKRCTNYAARPKDCKSYPHLHKRDMMARLMGVVENYGICPIVFNVYEALKRELWARKRAWY